MGQVCIYDKDSYPEESIAFYMGVCDVLIANVRRGKLPLKTQLEELELRRLSCSMHVSDEHSIMV